MIRAVLLSPSSLVSELGGTVLFRQNVDRVAASTIDEVRNLADGGRADVVVVDSALPNAAGLVSAIRQDPTTRATAINESDNYLLFCLCRLH